MTTTAYKGRSAIAKLSANGGSTFTVIGGVKTSNEQINNQPVDITNVSSAGWREMLVDGGTQSVDMDVDGVIASDATQKLLQTAAFARTSVLLQVPFGGSPATIQGTFVIDNFKLTGKIDDAQGFTCSLKSTGTVTLTADS